MKKSIENTFMNEKLKKTMKKKTSYPPSLGYSGLVLTPTTYKKPNASLVSMQLQIDQYFRRFPLPV